MTILYYKNGFMCKYMCLTCVRHVSYTCMTCGTITNQCLDLKNLHVESNFIRDNRNMVLCANTRVLHVSYMSHETITNQFLDLKYPHIKSKNIRLGQETQEICYTNNGSLWAWFWSNLAIKNCFFLLFLGSNDGNRPWYVLI